MRSSIIYFLLLTLALQVVAAADKPNVLLVMTDDQGYGDFSLHGNPLLETPNLDRFAREGIQFERFFVSPFCAPTRASLLTGRYSLRTGTWSVTHNKEAMRSSEVTLAEALRANGYRTGCFGKWHNGSHYPHTPTGQGFDEFLGFNHGHINNYFDTLLLRGTKPEKTKGYLTNVLSDEAIRFIMKQDEKDRPFFCYLSYNAPHTPTQIPDKWFNLFKAKGLDDQLAAIYGMCANLDENFARVIAALEKSDLRDNTIVLFLTDNGANSDRFNAGMRGRKVSVHEGGSRVPLFIQWPRRFEKAQVVRQLAAHIDLYPTILELCGAKAPEGPPIDGRSLVPLLENPEANWNSRLLFTSTNMGDTPKPFPAAVRSDQYRLVHARKSKAWELFDMQADPGETTNLAKRLPDKTTELANAYTQWWDGVYTSSFQRMPLPVGHAEQNPAVLEAVESYPEGLQFHHGPGFAHDWLTNWENTESKTEWDIDVVKSGEYEVELQYLSSESDAGAKIGLRCGDSVVYGITEGGNLTHIPLPHRDKEENKKYINRNWSVLRPGILHLEKGRQRLRVFATTKPGEKVVELKSVSLKFK